MKKIMLFLTAFLLTASAQAEVNCITYVRGFGETAKYELSVSVNGENDAGIFIYDPQTEAQAQVRAEGAIGLCKRVLKFTSCTKTQVLPAPINAVDAEMSAPLDSLRNVSAEAEVKPHTGGELHIKPMSQAYLTAFRLYKLDTTKNDLPFDTMNECESERAQLARDAIVQYCGFFNEPEFCKAAFKPISK
jgi:hypothetical protein